MLLRRSFPLIAALLLVACSSQSTRPARLAATYLQAPGDLGACARLFADVDALIRLAAAGDAQASRLEGFPYLRSNRLLASLQEHDILAGGAAAWLEELRNLDRQARRYELHNAGGLPAVADTLAELDDCGSLMMAADLQKPRQLDRIREAARVADDYVTAQRIFGLYALSRLPVIAGVRRLQRDIRARFKEPRPLAAGATLLSYEPAQAPGMSTAEIAAQLRRAGVDGLSLPLPGSAALDSLFQQFAPVWQVETLSAADRIGAPLLADTGTPRIDTGDPVVYQHLSYTRWQGELLPQFIFVVWFPRRPQASAFDLLSGELDGITWRVTVGQDGRVLMYDSMHNCGCYHMFFPVEGSGLRETATPGGEEPILVPTRVAPPSPGQRLHLRIAAGSHYIEAVTHGGATGKGIDYRVADYNSLRSLALPGGGHRSLFDAAGLVPGSERRERWLLWPMGVKSAGAMRQWGHHATAFVGRRHFDEADLLQRYFRLLVPADAAEK